MSRLVRLVQSFLVVSSVLGPAPSAPRSRLHQGHARSQCSGPAGRAVLTIQGHQRGRRLGQAGPRPRQQIRIKAPVALGTRTICASHFAVQLGLGTRGAVRPQRRLARHLPPKVEAGLRRGDAAVHEAVTDPRREHPSDHGNAHELEHERARTGRVDFRRAAAFLIAGLLLTSCGDRNSSPAAGTFVPNSRGVLTVLTTEIPSPGFWSGTPAHVTGGFEYELARDLGQRFGLNFVHVKLEPFNRIVSGHLDGADLALDIDHSDRAAQQGSRILDALFAISSDHCRALANSRLRSGHSAHVAMGSSRGHDIRRDRQSVDHARYPASDV